MLIKPLYNNLPKKIQINPQKINYKYIYILKNFYFKFKNKTNYLPHLLIYFYYIINNTQQL